MALCNPNILMTKWSSSLWVTSLCIWSVTCHSWTQACRTVASYPAIQQSCWALKWKRISWEKISKWPSTKIGHTNTPKTLTCELVMGQQSTGHSKSEWRFSPSMNKSIITTELRAPDDDALSFMQYKILITWPQTISWVCNRYYDVEAFG